MQHPFSGILPTNQSNSEATTSRRDALKTIAVGAIAVTAISAEALSASEKSVAEKAAKDGSYDRYLVVPSDFTKMSAANRKRLGIGGAFTRLSLGKKQKRGFLAWLNADAVATLKKNKHIADVIRITAATVPNNISEVTKQLAVVCMMMPNGWKTASSLPKDSYESLKKIAAAWKKQFAKYNPEVYADVESATISVKCRGTIPQAVFDTVKKHRQVAQVTVFAKKNNIGAPSTSKADFEEGGNQKTTAKLGEEGGNRGTTLAIGEEGGKMTTLKRGEEGGRFGQPTTKKRGEEGGKGRLLPPRKKTTTLKRGEEGGGNPIKGG